MPYSHGVRFEPEVPFVNLVSTTSTAHIKQLGLPRCEQGPAGLRVSPGLEAGARRRATRRFLLVVFKTLQLSKNVQGLALKTGGKKGNQALFRETKTDACRFDLRIPAPKRQAIPRKEVIQPQVPLRLPCYDFTPVIDHTVVIVLLTVRLTTSGAIDSHGVTGGVYKARERIHRDMLIRDY